MRGRSTKLIYVPAFLPPSLPPSLPPYLIPPPIRDAMCPNIASLPPQGKRGARWEEESFFSA